MSCRVLLYSELFYNVYWLPFFNVGIFNEIFTIRVSFKSIHAIRIRLISFCDLKMLSPNRHHLIFHFKQFSFFLCTKKFNYLYNSNEIGSNPCAIASELFLGFTVIFLLLN